MTAWDVLLLPGSVLPASVAYPALIAEVGPDVNAVAKELEVYAGPQPPSDYTLDTEVDGIEGEATAHGPTIWTAQCWLGLTGPCTSPWVG